MQAIEIRSFTKALNINVKDNKRNAATSPNKRIHWLLQPFSQDYDQGWRDLKIGFWSKFIMAILCTLRDFARNRLRGSRHLFFLNISFY